MDSVLCDPCSTRSRTNLAAYWCPYCSESFCRQCCQFHQTMKLTRNHTVRHTDDVPAKEIQSSSPGRSKWVDLTPKTFNEKTQLREIDDLLLNLDSLSDTALSLKKTNFDMKMKNEARKNEAMRKCLIFKARLKELADAFERHIANELDQLQHAENVVIESRIEDCESIFNSIEMSKDLTQNLKIEMITPNTLHKMNATRHRCQEFKSMLQRVHSQMTLVEYSLAIDRNVAEALNTSPGVIGMIEVTHSFDVDNEFYNQPATRRGSQASLTARSESQLRLDGGKPQKLHEIYVNRKDNQDEPMITSIRTLSDGNFVTLDRNNDTLHVYRPDGIVVIQYVFTSQIWDMAMIDQSTFAVTIPDTEKIVIVKLRETSLCAERVIKTSSFCYGICAIEGFLVVTVKGGYVKVLTKAGEVVASIRYNANAEILFQDPQYIATNPEQNEFYVTDFVLNTVTALALTGVKIDASPRFVFTHAELKNPTGIDIDSKCNIYVCGFASHNVMKLNSNGLLLQIVLTGIVNPQTVAISKMEDRLLVSTLCAGSRTKQVQNVIEVFRLF